MAALSTIATIATAGASIVSTVANDARIKSEAKAERRRIKAAEDKALDKRKQLIDTQRLQMGLGGQTMTKTTNDIGVSMKSITGETLG
jgi:hypothetical protein